MKKIITALMVATPFVFSVAYAAETQKVCIDKVTKDGKPVLGKDGKQVQDCKEMKVHKKLEGTKVPEKK
jgi:hypothetical protein